MMETEGIVLEARGVRLKRSGRPGASPFCLGPLDLRVRRGEVLAVVGASAAGKSTLLDLLTGSVRPDAGEVLLHVHGEAMALAGVGRAAWRRTRRWIGRVYQDPSASLHARRRVIDQVADPLRVHGLAPRRDARILAGRQLASVGLDAELVGRRPDQLSGGQRQRVAIARAHVHDPAIVFLDEPTSALDPTVQAGIIELLRDRRRAGVTSLLVTHDLPLVARLADRVAVLDNGRLVELGAVGRVLESPSSPALQGLLAAVRGCAPVTS